MKRVPRSGRTPGYIAALFIVAGLVGCNGDATELPTPTPHQQSATATPSPTPVDAGTSGVTDDQVLFGQSAAFSGPAEELGTNMRLGIRAAFHEANQAGGVHGRSLELISLDDSYEPEKAVTNTLQLIEDERVFMLMGAVGTPTSRSATPVSVSAGVPYLAPFTGAEFLRTLGPENVINVRASYNQETEEMVERLTEDLGITRIAVMYQDDSFGRAGYQGAVEALRRRNMSPVGIGLYTRNTTAVKTALLDIERSLPEAVIMVGAYEPVATFIRWARHIGMDVQFINISFVGSNALARELGPDGAGVFVTQVVPFPNDLSQPVVRAYRSALTSYDSSALPGFVSLEGYLAGRLVIAGLEGCGRDLTRQCFLDSLTTPDMIDLDGFRLGYGEDDNQGSDTVFLTVLGPDGQYYPIQALGDFQLLQETWALQDVEP
ncbi:MAG: ABC transporter substrate-binding protein [Chloroflexi bacterium]|nr:ABC transporter substrate-binding protein [Chloroflexota bacterium]MYA49939.1 ABC transporter substrate-binding protein [Chloroflexota bacterium]MYB83849.1 ABC transporter substrate-binding protein [Chloroflexota bacterium]MYK34695.1 ABC transporter substrate-binding protein [Chloroflexota bacterium]